MQVRLENIHANEIQQGNEKETLALIWAIILRYQSEYIDISYLVSFCLYKWGLAVPWGLYKRNYGSWFPFYVVLVTVHYTTILKCRFYTQLCVNNIEVTVNTCACACTIVFTVNTCTCIEVFTIITAKDQSGGIYNGHSTGWSGIYAYSKQTSSSGYTLELCLFTAIKCLAPCYNYHIPPQYNTLPNAWMAASFSGSLSPVEWRAWEQD